MQILRTEAIALFIALGLKKPHKWDNNRMSEKLDQLKDMVDESVSLPEAETATLQSVLQAINEKRPIEVIDSQETPPIPSVDEVREEELRKEEQKNKKEEVTVEPGELPTEKKVRKEERDQENAQEKEEKKFLKDGRLRPKSVRVSKTTAWHAGDVIRRNGLDKGITDAMVAELDEQRGKHNPAEAKAALNYCWHAINGYTQEFGLE